jgi:hypothetical protein
VTAGFSWREVTGQERAFSPRPLRMFQLEMWPMRRTVREPTIGAFTAGSVRLEEYRDWERADLVRSVTAEVLVERLPPVRIVKSETVDFPRPATWWEFFKLQYASRWWLRRLVRALPPRMVHVPVTATVTVDLSGVRKYPGAGIPFDSVPVLGRPVLHVAVDSSTVETR